MTRAAALALVLAACTPDPVSRDMPPETGPIGQLPTCAAAWRDLPPADLDRAGCRKPWLVLVYMAADTADLPKYARGDMDELAGALARPGADLELDVIVQLDVDAPPGVTRHSLVPPRGRLDGLPEPAGPPAEALDRFLEWGLARFPADRVAVVLWGHGQGWRPAGVTGPVHYSESGQLGGFGFDDDPGAVIDVPALADALAGAAARRERRQLDLLVVDACLMQSVEVTAALADTARYIVGHEQIDPYGGFPYDQVVARVLDPPRAPACPAADAACRIAAGLPDLLFAPSSLAGDGFAASAVDTAPLARVLVPALERLGAALSAYLAEDPLRGSDLLARMASHLPGEALPGFLGNTVDLGVLFARLEADARRELERGPTAATNTLLSALAEARDALAATVLDVAAGPAFTDDEAYAGTPGPAGLSVWLPRDPTSYHDRRAAFTSSPLHDPPGPDLWLEWLDRLYAAPN